MPDLGATFFVPTINTFYRSMFVGIITVCGFMLYLIIKDMLSIVTTWKQRNVTMKLGYTTDNTLVPNYTEDDYDMSYKEMEKGVLSKESLVSANTIWLTKLRNELKNVTNFKTKYDLDPSIKTTYNGIEGIIGITEDDKAADITDKVNDKYMINPDSKMLDKRYDDYKYDANNNGKNYLAHLFENAPIRRRPSDQQKYMDALEGRILQLEASRSTT
jgi:hypothetical protein